MLGTGKVYSLKAVQLVIGGVPILGGFVDDAITFEPDGDDVTVVNGADGNTVFNRTNIDTYTLTITVSETSPAAALLDGVRTTALAAQLIPSAPAILPGTLVDLLSGESASWASASPLRPPARSKGGEAGSRVFAFVVKAPIITPAALNAVR